MLPISNNLDVPPKKRVKFEREEASNSLKDRVSLLHRQNVEILTKQEIILSKLEEISKTIETQNRLPPPPSTDGGCSPTKRLGKSSPEY